jgi:ADP-heptose:LPS heptosyltransferase
VILRDLDKPVVKRLMKSKISADVFSTSRFWRMFPARMRRRWWLFRFFDLAVRYSPVLKKSSGLLVVRMDGIGDMVLFRRALDEYAGVFNVERANITVLGCKSWGPIGSIIFKGYNVYVIDEHAFARRPFYRLKVGLIVRQIAPAVTICDSYMRRAMMADSLVWMAGAPKSISSLPFINEKTRAEFTYYLSQVDQVIDTGPYPTHEVLRHYRFLSGVSGKNILPKVPKIIWRNERSAILQIKNNKLGYAVINPGSNEYGRRWPFENYLNIANKLIMMDLSVIIIGGQNEKVVGIPKIFNNERLVDLSGKTELPDLLDILNHAACVISNDTGPAHLSIALETPTVVIVGGGHFGSFVPYPEEICPPYVKFAFMEMPCYHCFWHCIKRESKHEAFPCVSDVSLDTVWRYTKELLSAG